MRPTPKDRRAEENCEEEGHDFTFNASRRASRMAFDLPRTPVPSRFFNASMFFRSSSVARKLIIFAMHVNY